MPDIGDPRQDRPASGVLNVKGGAGATDRRNLQGPTRYVGSGEGRTDQIDGGRVDVQHGRHGVFPRCVAAMPASAFSYTKASS